MVDVALEKGVWLERNGLDITLYSWETLGFYVGKAGISLPKMGLEQLQCGGPQDCKVGSELDLPGFTVDIAIDRWGSKPDIWIVYYIYIYLPIYYLIL